MGIRYEKSSILNWINEMGKFLRLIVDKWEGNIVDLTDQQIDSAYTDFFGLAKESFMNMKEAEILQFIDTLELEKIHPLGKLLLYDGLIQEQTELLKLSKFILEENMRRTGNYSFDDYGYLAKIDQVLAAK
ncbi:hypothetical protein ACFRAE_13995 [Sphingobacterium sp. HJSM2_6]|uniref:hypothetical protein n=1 Tax=Sphingobacterium sp. HJSM2_6 TaxID=3366264 RepID=UPI003BDD5166